MGCLQLLTKLKDIWVASPEGRVKRLRQSAESLHSFLCSQCRNDVLEVRIPRILVFVAHHSIDNAKGGDPPMWRSLLILPEERHRTTCRSLSIEQLRNEWLLGKTNHFVSPRQQRSRHTDAPTHHISAVSIILTIDIAVHHQVKTTSQDCAQQRTTGADVTSHHCPTWFATQDFLHPHRMADECKPLLSLIRKDLRRARDQLCRHVWTESKHGAETAQISLRVGDLLRDVLTVSDHLVRSVGQPTLCVGTQYLVCVDWKVMTPILQRHLCTFDKDRILENHIFLNVCRLCQHDLKHLGIDFPLDV